MEDKAIIAAMDITCAKINLFFHQHLILRLGLLILFLLVPKFNLAEGWKQMRPNNAVSGKLYLQWWGWYSSNPVVTNDYRIKIHIKSLSEKIYYGFHWTSGPGLPILHSRLLDPLGNLVQYSTIQPNNGSPGFIFDYNQAAAGPNVIDPAGYNALVYTPLMTGDYMFDLDQPLLNMPFDFDFTVIDMTNTPLVETEGRVWCKFWGIWANEMLQPGYFAKMYVLPKDSIVTSINFNGLNAGMAHIVLNRNGIFPPPANWIISRQSLVGSSAVEHYLEHKIFVNDPDSTVYPTGILGVIDTNSLTVTPDCNGTVGISFSTNKPGWVEVQIQIDPDPGIQPVDVLISDSVASGIAIITWDGLNGLGQPVQNGTPFSIGVKFLNGLTNLPIQYTWQNPNGFIVQLKRPAGPTPLLYWDDRQIDPTKYNLTGCMSYLPSSGCHIWPHTSPYNWTNVINTWWYASSTTATSPIVLFKRFFSSATDSIVCQGDTVIWGGQPRVVSGTYFAIYQSITGCDSICTLNLTVKPAPTLNLGPNVSECDGQSHTFDAGLCNTCTYQWANLTLGQLNIGTGQTYTTSQAGTYMVTKTDTNGCSSRDTVVLMVGNTPSITNTIYDFTICSGSSTNLGLLSNVPGTVFHWIPSLVSGNITGMSIDSGTIINQTLINHLITPGVVKYTVTPIDSGCTGTSKDFLFTVNPFDTVRISITTLNTTVCAETLVTFNASTLNGGSNPVYQWKVNAVNVIGANNAVYTYTPINGDQVQCVLTSSNTTCVTNNPATSNTITMGVDPIMPVNITIAAVPNPYCTGDQVTMTATPDHGGLTPTYLWKVNDIAMTATGPVYTYTPVNGDQVRCYMTSSLQCTTNNPATSNNIVLIENSNFPAGVNVTATANPFCPGTSVTYTAWPSNGGTSPSYQWKVNGTNAGVNLPTYTYSPQPGDSIRCIMTSNLSCVTGSPASSAKVIMSALPVPAVTFTTCFDTITTLNAKPIKLKGGLPPGGPYTGPGVNTATSVFTPSVAGIGTKTITYSYTNVALCSASKTKTITVQANPLFTCGNNLIDIRDNKVYPTVQIGSQCWMQTNLDFGTSINDLTHQTDNCIVEKYTPNSSLLTPNSFYQWDEVMRYDPTPGLQGLCPPGWHVPDETEWNTLFNFYQGNARAGYPLQDPYLNGFKALQNGVYYLNSMWSFTDFATLFWSSTMADQTRAYAHGMNTIDQSVSVYAGLKANGFSVRCLRD